MKVKNSVHLCVEAERIRQSMGYHGRGKGKLRKKARVHYVVPVNFTLEK